MIMSNYFKTGLLVAGLCMANWAFAQNVIEKEEHAQLIKEALGVEFLVSPLENNEVASEEYLKTPYRPTEVTTQNQLQAPIYRYQYIYDREGKNLGATGPCMVRIHQKWNSKNNAYVNDARFKAVMDENGDMYRYYNDRGNSNEWENSYRFVATYDNNHNQLTASQEFWSVDEWVSKLRWTNEYDANGRITTQTYENRASADAAWIKGLRVSWTYDENGYETSRTYEQFKKGKYEPDTKNVFTRDERGNQLTRTQQQYGVNVVQQTYTYDDNNNVLTAIEERWNKKDNFWFAIRNTSYVYNSDHKVASGLELMSNDSLPLAETTWKNYAKMEMLYFGPGNANERKTTSLYNNETEKWQDYKRTITQYNKKGNALVWAEDTYDVITNIWTTMNREMNTYDANFNLTEYKFQTYAGMDKGEDGTPFVVSSLITYEYDENNNALTTSAFKKQEKEFVKLPYNNMVHAWACPEFDSWFATATSYLNLNDYVVPTGVSFAADNATVKIGESIRLQASVAPQDASNKEVHWESLNEEIARVDVDGEVTGVSEGTATIQATTLEGLLKATCQVTVNSGASIDEYSLTYQVSYQNNEIQVSGESIMGVRVYDMNGRVMMNNNSNNIIPTDSWNKGVYFVEVVQGDRIRMNKVVVY